MRLAHRPKNEATLTHSQIHKQHLTMGLAPLSPSRGSTGRTGSGTCEEQLAMEQVQQIEAPARNRPSK